MSHERFDHHRQPGARAPQAWQSEPNEAAWERVLDCGAPGPGRDEPALFYQSPPPDRRPPAPQRERS